MTTPDRVRKLLGEFLGVPIEDRFRLAEDLEADSLDRVEIVMSLEEEFLIDITDADTQAMRTVADVIALVKGKVK